MLSRKSLFGVLFFCLSLGLLAGYVNAAELFRVTKVIDGDTIVLEDGEHVRYIGMDTPEKGRPYYGEAKRENERLVKGKTVKLEYDVGKTDRYGRTLAYVYVDEIFVNAELVKDGYAVLLTVPPNVKHVDEFRALQEGARKGKRGIWGLAPSDSNSGTNSSVWDYILYRLKRIFK